jgi:hypothetical protein
VVSEYRSLKGGREGAGRRSGIPKRSTSATTVSRTQLPTASCDDGEAVAPLHAPPCGECIYVDVDPTHRPGKAPRG